VSKKAWKYRNGSVGPDLLCKDINTDRRVLIENQLECTDYTHLGQLLTYASCLEAATIVWIAKSFAEEHRSTLDWLNKRVFIPAREGVGDGLVEKKKPAAMRAFLYYQPR
jgi:hypothetical protein